MGRVTYLHHYLPTLWFAVLTAGHVLDTIIFSNRRLSPTTKWIAFAITSGLVVGISLWFRAIAFGMHGPAHDYWGLRWRKTWNVSRYSLSLMETKCFLSYRCFISRFGFLCPCPFSSIPCLFFWMDTKLTGVSLFLVPPPPFFSPRLQLYDGPQ